ncbi:NAD(P)H-binding protein [Embleya sp. NPDC001921]
MILIVGATARFGRETVEILAATGTKVRALSRTPENAGLPAGVDVVRGDLTDAASLRPALDGVEKIFLVLPYGMDPSTLLTEAADAGVRHIVFLSSGAVVGDADDVQSDVIAAYHAGVEKAVVARGLDWTFLRLLFPAINTLSFAPQLRESDIVRAPYAGAAASVVHERDVAEAAAAVLTGDGHAQRVYDLTGPASLTQAEQVRVLGETLGRPLALEELDDGPVREQMSHFLDAPFVNALFDLMAATVDRPAPVNDTIQRLVGHPARTYAQWAADHRADFS